MKKRRIFLLIMMILSFVWCIYNAADAADKKDWEDTTAVIDWIGLPDGEVFGTYTDKDGKVYSGPLYLGSFLSGYSTKTEKYVGKKVRIIYQPQTGKVLNYSEILIMRCLSVGSFAISGLLFVILKRKK